MFFIAEAQLPPAGGKKKRIYAIAVDGSGKLRWASKDMRGDQLVVLTTNKASCKRPSEDRLGGG